ncbi:MAG TPA: DUF2934 domain-containing protein [Steroidobacteraceae bacterium]|nr:DUF2934 domain-containing protein [Steroidobacteraceae bacterium]
MTTSKRTTRRESTASPAAQPANGAAPPAKARAARKKSPPSSSPSAVAASLQHEDRHASIARAAYFRSQLRGFAPGYELEDWLAAEAEVDQRLRG